MHGDSGVSSETPSVSKSPEFPIGKFNALAAGVAAQCRDSTQVSAELVVRRGVGRLRADAGVDTTTSDRGARDWRPTVAG